MKFAQIIYISYYFPPIHSIAVLRNYFLAHHLQRKVENIKVLTTQNQKYFPYSQKDLGGLQIKNLPTLDYRTITNIFKRDKKTLHFDESTKKNPYVKFLIKLNETLPFSLLLGEGGLVYIVSGLWHAAHYIRPLKEKSVIFTPYRPTANIIIGYGLKLLCPQSLWIISMHDIPYIYRRPNSYWPKIQKYFWRQLFKKADHVLTLSYGLAAEFKKYGVDTPVIINGIVSRTPVSAQSNIFTITFTGSLYDGLIHPLNLFESLENLLSAQLLDKSKIQIVYAGKDRYQWMSYAQSYPKTHDIIKTYDVLPHQEALHLQEKSHINLILSWNDENVKGILTGKLFEYLGARNPILTIIQGEIDKDFESIFEELKCGKITYTTDVNMSSKIEDFILNKYQIWQEGHYEDTYTSQELLANYTWEAQIDKLWQIIE